MQNVFQPSIPGNAMLDAEIKGLGLLLLFERLMPPQLSGRIAMLLALLLAARLIFWKPHLAIR